MRKPGCNPLVVLGLMESKLDPQLIALLQTLREVRISGDEVHWDSKVVAQATGTLQLPKCSPASIIVDRLHQVGISVHPGGVMHDNLGDFHMFATNFAEIELRVLWAWTVTTAHRVSYRHDFQGIGQVDVVATHKAIRTFPKEEQQLLRVGLSGTFFTDDTQTHKTGRDSSCKLCGGEDSVHHRYWSCSCTAHLRVQFASGVMEHAETLPRALVDRGWALLPPLWETYVTTLAALPGGIPSLQVPFRAGWNEVFTDGSCFHQDDQQLRLAAWGAVLAAPCDEHWAMDCPDVLGGDVLPGLIQTAFRAELYAVGFVLHHAACHKVSIRIWSDCKGVVSRFQLYSRGLKLRPTSPNADLWEWVLASVEQLGLDRVELRKTEAHRHVSEAKTREQCWRFFHNGAADRTARVANGDRPSAFWDLWERLASQFRLARSWHAEVTRLHVEVAKFCTKQTEIATPDESAPAEPRSVRQFDMVYEEPSVVRTALPVTSRIYGFSMTQRLAHWWRRRISGHGSRALQWVSFGQLYVDYQLSTGCPGPVKHGKQWLDCGLHTFLSAEQFNFCQRTEWFRLALKRLWKEQGITVGLAQRRPTNTAILAQIPCCSVGWDEWCLQQADGWMGQQLKGIVARSAKVLKNLPVASRSEAMRVEVPAGLR
eukprot:Skav216189  [mRNA]  locus=scaffold5649:139693:141654:- [translate_table: standard]